MLLFIAFEQTLASLSGFGPTPMPMNDSPGVCKFVAFEPTLASLRRFGATRQCQWMRLFEDPWSFQGGLLELKGVFWPPGVPLWVLLGVFLGAQGPPWTP